LSDSSAITSNSGTQRTLVVFTGASLAAVACGAAVLALRGVPLGSWVRNPVAWLVGAVAGGGVMLAGRSVALARAVLVLAVAAIAGTFLGPAQQGVHRWIDAGPLHVNVAALVLPPAVVALAFCGIWSRTGAAFATTIAVLLVLQPDASQATSFLVAVMILLARSTASSAARLTAGAVALLTAAGSWMRPDPLEPVPEVEGIFSLALNVSPALAGAAALALVAVCVAPLAIRATAGTARRSAALALAGYFAAVAICPAFGAFPVPLVGLGMSFPVGYWLGVALLCAEVRGLPDDRSD
jgi:hypothetical protein